MSVSLSSIGAFEAALAGSRDVNLAAYTLNAGETRAALAEAAHRGAVVRVRLERDPLDNAAGSLHAANDAAIAVLSAAGADAALSAAGAPVLHLKAAIVDGVGWLDDRNWTADGYETVVRDTDAEDLRSLSAALAGDVCDNGNLRTTKAGAQCGEADVLRAAGGSALAVESESFGNGTIYNLLLKRGQSGLPTRLLVAGREARELGAAGDTERRHLAKLQSFGIAVRCGNPHGIDLNEKFAISTAAAWVGSANATYARGAAGEQRDWGLTLHEPASIDDIRKKFEANWDGSLAFIA